MNYTECKKVLDKVGQTQLLDYYEELDENGRAELLHSVENIDFSVLKKLKLSADRRLGNLSPADALTVEEIEERRAEYEEAGLRAIRLGKVAAVLLAGGQGTRLGWSAPKGTYDIGVNLPLSIFECQMRTLGKVVKRAGRYIHLFIMTSTVNDAATRAFFEEHGYFGYDKNYVHFYVQSLAPAISFDGKILLEEKHKPALSPNGNGGWYTSLCRSQCGEIVKNSGIEWLNVYGVDNVLQYMCDPAFVGAAILGGVSCAGKVVKKTCADEKVGVLCKEDGLPAIVEYYEMPENYRNERDENGGLKFGYGVILNYLFSVKKLDSVNLDNLPYHMAAKKIPCIVNGEKVIPSEPNGYKPETLAVDIIKLMGNCLGFEVVREREFAPVKNKTGVDSVESARALLVKNGVQI